MCHFVSQHLDLSTWSKVIIGKIDLQLQLVHYTILKIMNWLYFELRLCSLVSVFYSPSVMTVVCDPESSEEYAAHNELPFTLKGPPVLQDRGRS